MAKDRRHEAEEAAFDEAKRTEAEGAAASGDRKKEGEKSKRPRSARGRKKKTVSENSMIHQVMPVVMLALCAFLGICIYTEASVGVVGDFFAMLFFGLFGMASYFIPPLCLLSAIFWQKDAKQHILLRKLIFGTLCLALIAVLFYTFGVADAEKGSISSFWSMGRNKIGGGVLGNIIGFALYSCVAKMGTVILSVLLLLIFLILFFDLRLKTIAEGFSRLVRYMVKAHRAAKKRAKDARVEKEQDKRARREEAEEAFYEKKAVSTVPTVTAPSHGGLPGTSNSFLVNREIRPGQAPVTRQFYDSEADTSSFTSRDAETEKAPNEPSRAEAPQPFEDSAFFTEDTPSAVPIYRGERLSTPAGSTDTPSPSARAIVGGTSERAKPEDAEDGIPFATVEVVREQPIPQKPLAPEARAFFRDEDEDEEEEEKLQVQEEEAPVEQTDAEEPLDEPEKEKLVINKAHTIEHIGADKFIDEAEEYYKTQSADTFFYSFPPLSLLHEEESVSQEDSDQEIAEKSDLLIETLRSFGVAARTDCASRGPRLTRYELIPEPGVRIRAIENLVDEIAMNLRAASVRIEAPIPGKAAVGVEVPNTKYSTVRLRGLLDTDKFRDAPGKTTVCLGVDVVGVPVFADLDKMPHLLVAGATGMGKSVCINSILVSLLYKARPDEVKLILIDPKKVEFKAYYNIPHLLVPVVTEAQKAAGALSWAVNEMERRYDIIERTGVRNIKAYNATLADHPEREKIPQIVIVIDELHDLMIQARDAVEDSIARIAAKARAAGILLIIGTQRPSVNVITGVIKANIPSRIAFHVASQVDSRTILDTVGAEKLLNDGDMLFLSPGMKMMTPKRVQGAFLDDDEVTRVADYLRKNSSGVRYDEAVMADMDRESEKYNKDKKPAGGDMPMADGAEGGEDDLFYRAVEVALESGKISTSLLQRKLSLGFGKAARMIDRMQELGIVSAPNGQKPRDVLITMDEYRAMRLRNDE